MMQNSRHFQQNSTNDPLKALVYQPLSVAVRFVLLT